MKNKRLILLIISIFMIVASLGVVLAFLIDTKEKEEPIRYEFGNISLSVTGDLMEDYIYPGKNLVTEDFVLTNSSTIDIHVRVLFKFYLEDMVNEIDPDVYFEEFDFNSEPSDEVWDLDDGYYYYIENEGILLPSETILLFTTLVLDGWVVKNQYSNETFKIKLVIQAKQTSHATWEDLGGKFIN